MKTIYTSKSINPNHYMVIGIDDNLPIIYIYKDGELFDYHVSVGTSFEIEMKNIIDCYIQTHGHEPTIGDIVKFRNWFKLLKGEGIIS